IEPLQRRAAFRQRSNAIQSHGIETLEDVAPLTVLWKPTGVLDEPFNLLEAGDDSLLARRTPSLRLRLGLDPQFVQKIKIFIRDLALFLSHSCSPSRRAAGKQPLPPFASPRGRPR